MEQVRPLKSRLAFLDDSHHGVEVAAKKCHFVFARGGNALLVVGSDADLFSCLGQSGDPSHEKSLQSCAQAKHQGGHQRKKAGRERKHESADLSFEIVETHDQAQGRTVWQALHQFGAVVVQVEARGLGHCRGGMVGGPTSVHGQAATVAQENLRVNHLRVRPQRR